MKNSMATKATASNPGPRTKSGDAETILWRHLHTKRFAALKFKRQQPIGRYVVAFVSLEKKLIIEIDGGPRYVRNEADGERDQWLRDQGFVVLRFWTHSVLKGGLAGVLDVLDRYLTEPAARYH